MKIKWPFMLRKTHDAATVEARRVFNPLLETALDRVRTANRKSLDRMRHDIEDNDRMNSDD